MLDAVAWSRPLRGDLLTICSREVFFGGSLYARFSLRCNWYEPCGTRSSEHWRRHPLSHLVDGGYAVLCACDVVWLLLLLLHVIVDETGGLAPLLE